MTGDEFLRGLISPIPTASILYTLQSGYPADFVLGWTVESSPTCDRGIKGNPREKDAKRRVVSTADDE